MLQGFRRWRKPGAFCRVVMQGGRATRFSFMYPAKTIQSAWFSLRLRGFTSMFIGGKGSDRSARPSETDAHRAIGNSKTPSHFARSQAVQLTYQQHLIGRTAQFQKNRKIDSGSIDVVASELIDERPISPVVAQRSPEEVEGDRVHPGSQMLLFSKSSDLFPALRPSCLSRLLGGISWCAFS
jgi:hypothetical protein